jgi:acyl-coenzyme A thioesterase PaaI-like protein
MLPRFWSRIPVTWRPTLARLGLNWFPAYRATGARLIHVSPDLKRAVVRLPLTRRTKNGAGTLYGGSLYSATDPIFAMLLAMNLGRDYVVWDKAASIRYRRPGRGALLADFRISDEDLAVIRETVEREGQCDRTFYVEFRDGQGVVHVEIEKTVYVACKDHYRARTTAPESPQEGL